MSNIPLYPVFAPFSTEMKEELVPVFSSLKDGMSELTFPSLILHQDKYDYRISKTTDTIYILSRSFEEKSAFICINGLPPKEIFFELLNKYGECLKIGESLLSEFENLFVQWGLTVEEDRDNFDYVYNKNDLALLSGKKFHKKKNLVNAFTSLYSLEVKMLDEASIEDALFILERWNEKHKNEVTDYEVAQKALQNMKEFDFSGWVIYADGAPCGWSLGEYLLDGTVFCVHFEKGIDDYKGVYQYVNYACANQLAKNVLFINREQDLGNEGLRQAKLTYRPCFLTKKYKIHL
ncbi:MAG: DUF2156 domain-containing protein [Treponemataceae bacterium]